MMDFIGPINPHIRVDAGDRIEVLIHKADGTEIQIHDTTLTDSLVISSFAAINFVDAFEMTKGVMLALGFKPTGK